MDPGVFTVNEKALDVNTLNKLDYITITHEHPDHMAIPLIKELVTKFPAVKIVTNASIVGILEKEGIKAQANNDEVISFEDAPHEKLWDTPVPENIVITALNKLTHPGDSLHFNKTADILALPLTAPWGSTTEAIEKALSLKPKYIVPIHDWLWKDGVRQMMYQRLTEYFETKDIEFNGLETGITIEI